MANMQNINADSIEEKIGKDGTHSRKEVHNENGHRTVHITEEKKIEIREGTTGQTDNQRFVIIRN